MDHVGPVTSHILDRLIEEMNKPENKEKIFKGVLNPAVNYMESRIYPYILWSCFVIIALLVLALCILWFSWKKMKANISLEI